MKKPIRRYYERNNHLIQQYLYIDRLLDSSLPHDLLGEYNQPLQRATSRINIPATIDESPASTPGPVTGSISKDSVITAEPESINGNANGVVAPQKVKRTPKNLYKIPDVNENTPLLTVHPEESDLQGRVMPAWEPEDEADSGARIVVSLDFVSLQDPGRLGHDLARRFSRSHVASS